GFRFSNLFNDVCLTEGRTLRGVFRSVVSESAGDPALCSRRWDLRSSHNHERVHYKTNNLATIRDSTRQRSVQFLQPSERFTNDDELTFDRRAKQIFSSVFRERTAGGELLDQLRRTPDVLQQGRCVMQHRGAAAV